MIACVQVHDAVADLEAHEVLIERRVFVQRNVFQGELAGGTERVEIEIAAPGNFFAAVRDAGKGVGIFIVGVGAEMIERDVQRPDEPFERCAGGEVRQRHGGAGDVQPFNSQHQRPAGEVGQKIFCASPRSRFYDRACRPPPDSFMLWVR